MFTGCSGKNWGCCLSCRSSVSQYTYCSITSWSSCRSSRAGFNPVLAREGSKGSMTGTADRRLSASLTQMYSHRARATAPTHHGFVFKGKYCFIFSRQKVIRVQSAPVLCPGHNFDWAEIRHSTADWLFSLLEPPGFLPCSPRG